MNYDRGFAYACGVILLAIGICGFIPPLLSPAVAGPSDVGATGHVIQLLNGDLMHSFHVNVVLDVIYLLVGGLGFMMASQSASARRYAQIVCLAYATLAVLGCLPQTSTLFGLAPISGHDIAAHIFIAVIAGVFGFIIGPEDWSAIGTHEVRGQHLDELPSHGNS